MEAIALAPSPIQAAPVQNNNQNKNENSQIDASPMLRRILRTADRYAEQMQNHPLAKVFASPDTPRELVEEYAGLQYVDSVLWVPMLAIMKDRVESPLLKKALTDNLLCEAGARHKSHVMLCQEFIRSIGLSPYYGNFRAYSELAQHPIEVMNGVSGMSEAQIAGMNLVSEGIVPHLFRMALPAFARIPGADVSYLTEHITVDADEHAEWMKASVAELIARGTDPDEIATGVHLGGRTALSIPDALYAKFLRGGYRKDSHL